MEGAKTGALEAVGALVQQAEDAAIRQPKLSEHDTWMIWDAASGQYVDTGLYAGGQAPYIGEDGYWYVGNIKTDTLARGPKGDPGEGVPSTEGVPTDYLLSPAGWVAPPSGGGGVFENFFDTVLEEQVASFTVELPEKYNEFLFVFILDPASGANSTLDMRFNNDLAYRIQFVNGVQSVENRPFLMYLEKIQGSFPRIHSCFNNGRALPEISGFVPSFTNLWTGWEQRFGSVTCYVAGTEFVAGGIIKVWGR